MTLSDSSVIDLKSGTPKEQVAFCSDLESLAFGGVGRVAVDEVVGAPEAEELQFFGAVVEQEEEEAVGGTEGGVGSVEGVLRERSGRAVPPLRRFWARARSLRASQSTHFQVTPP